MNPLNDWTIATVCLVLGFAVTTYYYRVIRRGNFKLSPVAIEGELWWRTPNRLRIPMWIASGFFGASLLELVSLFLGSKLSLVLFRPESLSMISMILALLALLLTLLEKNPFHLSYSQRTYPFLLVSLAIGAALAFLISSYS